MSPPVLGSTKPQQSQELRRTSQWSRRPTASAPTSLQPLGAAHRQRSAADPARTHRLRIGLAAAILPFHHPLRLAEQFALVDVISRGRLDMGVGRGNRPTEFRGYQVPQQESRERFEEAVDILMHAWNEE